MTSEPSFDSRFSDSEAIRLPPEQRADVLRLQMLTVGMAVGVLVMYAAVLFLQEGDIPGDAGLLSGIGMAVVVFVWFSHLFVPGLIRRYQLEQLRAEDFQDIPESGWFTQLFPVYQAGHLTGCALLEGGAMLNLVLCFVAPAKTNLAAGVVLAGLLLLKFPTTGRISDWMRQTREQLEMKFR